MPTTNKQAFVILIAVVVSSLLLSLGAFIANIAVKEIALSSSGRQSQLAFYAADAAVECVLYQDLRVQAFAATSSAAGPSSVNCDGNDAPVIEVIGDSNTGVTYIDFSFVRDGSIINDSPYAKVRIIKDKIGTVDDSTTIEALGYNIYDQTESLRVERALTVTY